METAPRRCALLAVARDRSPQGQSRLSKPKFSKFVRRSPVAGCLGSSCPAKSFAASPDPTAAGSALRAHFSRGVSFCLAPIPQRGKGLCDSTPRLCRRSACRLESRALRPEGTAGLSPGFQPIGVKISDLGEIAPMGFKPWEDAE